MINEQNQELVHKETRQKKVSTRAFRLTFTWIMNLWCNAMITSIHWSEKTLT